MDKDMDMGKAAACACIPSAHAVQRVVVRRELDAPPEPLDGHCVLALGNRRQRLVARLAIFGGGGGAPLLLHLLERAAQTAAQPAEPAAAQFHLGLWRQVHLQMLLRERSHPQHVARKYGAPPRERRRREDLLVVDEHRGRPLVLLPRDARRRRVDGHLHRVAPHQHSARGQRRPAARRHRRRPYRRSALAPVGHDALRARPRRGCRLRPLLLGGVGVGRRRTVESAAGTSPERLRLRRAQHTALVLVVPTRVTMMLPLRRRGRHGGQHRRRRRGAHRRRAARAGVVHSGTGAGCGCTHRLSMGSRDERIARRRPLQRLMPRRRPTRAAAAVHPGAAAGCRGAWRLGVRPRLEKSARRVLLQRLLLASTRRDRGGGVRRGGVVEN